MELQRWQLLAWRLLTSVAVLAGPQSLAEALVGVTRSSVTSLSAFSDSRRSPSLIFTVLLALTSLRLSSHSHPLLVLTLILCFSSSLCSFFPSQSRPAILKKITGLAGPPSLLCLSGTVPIFLTSPVVFRIACHHVHHANNNSSSNSCSSASSLTSQTEQLSQLLESSILITQIKVLFLALLLARSYLLSLAILALIPSLVQSIFSSSSVLFLISFCLLTRLFCATYARVAHDLHRCRFFDSSDDLRAL